MNKILTLQAHHISKPLHPFLIDVHKAPCHNVFYRPPRWETVRFLAENKIDAMKVAQYHFYRASEFKLHE